MIARLLARLRRARTPLPRAPYATVAFRAGPKTAEVCTREDLAVQLAAIEAHWPDREWVWRPASVRPCGRWDGHQHATFLDEGAKHAGE